MLLSRILRAKDDMTNRGFEIVKGAGCFDRCWGKIPQSDSVWIVGSERPQ